MHHAWIVFMIQLKRLKTLTQFVLVAVPADEGTDGCIKLLIVVVNMSVSKNLGYGG